MMARSPWLAIWGAVLACLMVVVGIRMGGSVSGVRLLVVNAAYEPVDSAQLQYRGPVGGHMNMTRGSGFQFPLLPMGDYHLRIDSSGFEPYYWRQRLDSRLQHQLLLIRLNPIQRVTKAVPFTSRVTLGRPLLIQLDANLNDSLYWVVYRLKSPLILNEQWVMADLTRVLRRQPISHDLNPSEWKVSWRGFLDSTQVIREGSSVMPVHVPFDQPGLYVIEFITKRQGVRFQPIRYPILVTPFVALQVDDGRLFFVRASDSTIAGGVLFKSKLVGESLQLTRAMTIHQFNQSQKPLQNTDAILFKSADGFVDVLPYSSKGKGGGMVGLLVTDRLHRWNTWVMPSGQAGTLRLIDEKTNQVQIGKEAITLAFTNGVAKLPALNGQSGWELFSRGGKGGVTLFWGHKKEGGQNGYVMPTGNQAMVMKGGQPSFIPVLAPSGTPWACYLGTRTVAQGVVEKGRVSLTIDSVGLVLPADAELRVGGLPPIPLRIWHPSGHPSDMGKWGVRILNPLVMVGDVLTIMTQSDRVTRVWLAFPTEWGMPGEWITVGPTVQYRTYRIRYPSKWGAVVTITGIRDSELDTERIPVHAMVMPTHTPPDRLLGVTSEVVPNQDINFTWQKSDKTGSRLTWVGFSIQRPMIPDLMAQVGGGVVRLPVQLLGVWQDSFNQLRDQRFRVRVPNQSGFLSVISLHDRDGDGITQSVTIIPVGKTVSIGMPTIRVFRPLDRLLLPIQIVNHTPIAMTATLNVLTNTGVRYQRAFRLDTGRQVKFVWLVVPAMAQSSQMRVRVTIQTPRHRHTHVSRFWVHPVRLPLARWEVPVMDQPERVPAFVSANGVLGWTGNADVVMAFRRLARSPISQSDGADWVWQTGVSGAMHGLSDSGIRWLQRQQAQRWAYLTHIGMRSPIPTPLNQVLTVRHNAHLPPLSLATLMTNQPNSRQEWLNWTMAGRLLIPQFASRYSELMATLATQMARWPVLQPTWGDDWGSVGGGLALRHGLRHTLPGKPLWQSFVHSGIPSQSVLIGRPFLRPVSWAPIQVTWGRIPSGIVMNITGLPLESEVVIPLPTGASQVMTQGGFGQVSGDLYHIWGVQNGKVTIFFPNIPRSKRVPSVGWVRTEDLHYFMIPEGDL